MPVVLAEVSWLLNSFGHMVKTLKDDDWIRILSGSLNFESTITNSTVSGILDL